MEQVLDTYQRPLDPACPVVCVDEVSQTLHAHARPPQPPRPGPPARQDYEYRRQGACNLFLLTAPLLGWRHVAVTARRTRQDFAQMLHDLTEVHFPDAERITLVCDNLNTHKPGVLCDRYAPALARRSAQRLEWVYTPKHGSWLNIAEIEIQVLKRQALRQRFPDRAALECQTAAWTAQRNALGAPVDWRFTPDDARIQLRSLYPQTQAGGYTRRLGFGVQVAVLSKRHNARCNRLPPCAVRGALLRQNR